MPDDFWANIISNLPIYFGAISAISGGLVVVYKKVLKPLIKANEEYRELLRKVDVIAEEMVPNGGNSLKDIVHRIEKEVTLSSERAKAVLADDRAAIFETDSEGNCVWVNRTYSRVVKRTPHELMGHGWVNAIAKVDRERVVTGWNIAVSEDREFADEFSFETPEGEIIPCRVVSYKMINRSKDTIGYLGICHIIRAKKSNQ